MHILIRNECLFLSKDKKKGHSSLILTPNWKDIQCPFTVEGINDGIIIQWNIYDWVGGEGDDTHMDDSKT